MKLFAVFIVLVLLGLVSSLPNSVHAQSPKDADSWDWPLKPWNKFTVGHSSNGGLGFGQWVGSTRHGGIDVWERPDKSAKETVYAAANGIVSYVCQSPGSKKHCGGFGYPNDVNTGRLYRAVLISHRLPDGTHVTSVYGHLNPDTPQVKVGDPVEKGKIIGYLAPTGDCGETCDVAHLHFGIRRGWYEEPGFPAGGWGYVPASIEKTEFPMWEEPVGFIKSGNLSWLKTSYSINIAFPWRYTFGFCDGRSIKFFLDNNLVIDTSSKDGKVPNLTATVGLWRGDHAVRTEVLDTIQGISPELKMVAWPASIECKGQVLGTSAAAQPTIAPVPTVASPSTIIASGSSTLNIPTLVSPPNGGLVSYTTSISLIWKPVAGASSYRVEFLGDQNPTSLPCGVNVNVICSFKDLKPGKLYWHVKAIGTNGIESNWSEAWSFTIQESGTTSTTSSKSLKGNLSLEGHADRTNITLTWMWDGAQPDGYKIYLDGQLHTTINSPNATSHSITLPCGKLYTFYLTAYNASGESPKSNTSRAYTGDCASQIGYIDNGGNVWVMSAIGSEPKKLTSDGGNYHITWSRDGTKIAFQHELPDDPNIYGDEKSELNVMNADGSNRKNFGNLQGCLMIEWAPEPEKILCEVEDIAFSQSTSALKFGELYGFDIRTQELTPLLEAGEFVEGWTASCGNWGCGIENLTFATKSKRLAIVSYPDDGITIWILNGSTVEKRFKVSEHGGGQDAGRPCCYDMSWSPDERYVAFLSFALGGLDHYIGLLDTNSGQVKKITVPANSVTFSPDGNWVVYSLSTESNTPCNNAIFKTNLSNHETSRLVSGCYPSWQPRLP